MTMIDHALNYAQNGIFVFPCSVSKQPLCAHGFKDATKDEAIIRAWWLRWPNAAIGMPTGKINGIVVLDIDVDREKGIDGEGSFANLLKKQGVSMPVTRTVRTPRGGRHVHLNPLGAIIKSSASKSRRRRRRGR